ncbi:DUF3515 family protein [Microbacterium sp. NPDC055910]|uniref:DUF3515 family protein n=1 Tax=Microbacterium sp. NPDC055910 TaxID=3345659 RepID=UPI0035E1E2E2
MRASRVLSSLVAATALAAVLAGCSTTVALQPAPDANDPLCAEITVRLPGSVDGEQRRWTDAQATGAWGSDDTSIILACGVTPPGPTEARCITLGGIDWVVDESQAPRYLVTTYGRTPAIEVFVDNEVVSSNAVLDRLGPIISAAIPAERACINTSDALEGAED